MPEEEKSLSNILKKGEGGKFGHYSLEQFEPATDDSAYEVKISERTFEPDSEGEGVREFLPGGFDSAEGGGLTRVQILNRTMNDAKRILENARAEAGEVTQEAHKKGFDTGYEEGRAKAEKEASNMISAFEELTRELVCVREKYYGQAEEEMIDLVISVAGTVLGIEFQGNRELIRKIILRAVGMLQAREEMKIRINPKDFAEAEKSKNDLAKEVEDIDKVTFKSDPMISEGGCVVETNIGSIDARIETQLNAIREQFLVALDESRSKDLLEKGEEKNDMGTGE